jgi:TolA-binding protein
MFRKKNTMRLQVSRSLLARLVLASALLLPLTIGLNPNIAAAQSSADQSGLSALVSRQQQRMDMLEEGLKDVRGTIEMELRNIRTELENIAAASVVNQSGASSDFKSFQGELAKLADNIGIVGQRINNTLDLYSDIEFRILRLEKRLNTLLSLSEDDIAEKLAQTEVAGAGAGPSVSMSRDASTGQTVWTIEQDKLEEQLESDNASSAAPDNAPEASITEANSDTPRKNNTTEVNASANNTSANSTSANNTSADNTSIGASPATPGAQALAESQGDVAIAEPTPSILPDASTEDQFRFALTSALQNDLETAEQAFTEFSDLYPEHERSSDALFWLGRVQFIQGQFEKSATTFSKFNALYSTDPRLPDTTLWIAESVSKFASPEQACDIYDNLGKFLDQPPESFVARLKELSDGANCSS